jgi:hypothetical protein
MCEYQGRYLVACKDGTVRSMSYLETRMNKHDQ